MEKPESPISKKIAEPLMVPEDFPNSAELLWKAISEDRWKSVADYRRISPDIVAQIAQENGLPEEGMERLTPTMALFHKIAAPPMKLEQQFPTSETFSRWYVLDGIRELKLADFATQSQIAFLTEPHPDFPDLSRFWGDVWISRPDLQLPFPRKNSVVSERYKRWVIMNGIHEYRSYRLISDDIVDFCLRDIPLEADPVLSMPNFFSTLLDYRPDVLASFLSIPAAERRSWFSQWFWAFGADETGFEFYPDSFKTLLTQRLNRLI